MLKNTNRILCIIFLLSASALALQSCNPWISEREECIEGGGGSVYGAKANASGVCAIALISLGDPTLTEKELMDTYATLGAMCIFRLYQLEKCNEKSDRPFSKRL